MKHTVLALLTFLSITLQAQPTWQPAGDKIKTNWASQITPQNVHAEYPRPQMVRETWMSLNGLWDYAIRPAQEENVQQFDGKILVPFAVESSLSGVGKVVGKENRLWYSRTVNMPKNFQGKTVLLHFGAVDWRCEVFVNNQSVGRHEGGYDPFFFDITKALTRSGQQKIVVTVWDPSDEGPQPRGKQVKNPNSIWYTPVTGIWQTVWLEAVPKTFIAALHTNPDIDQSNVSVNAVLLNSQPGDQLVAIASIGQQKIAEGTGSDTQVSLKIANATVWSPANPFLYDLTLRLVRKGKVVDEVKSYFAMRKMSMRVDANGIQRMLLNNQFLFQYGPLDQGWWPDGLYTAPSDEALKFDIVKTKDMGFNMIRKHVKVEPARWYYYCDQLGMLVWQDMPSGDMGNRWGSQPGVIGIATEKERTAESENIFRKEWKAIMDATKFFPSVVVWVPFNEAWGQFKTKEIIDWTKSYDPTRLVNEASGGNYHYISDILDYHNYPDPAMPDPKLFGEKQVIVLGEYGGLGLPMEGHTWQDKNNWGYQSFKNQDELYQKYEAFIGRIPALIEKGLSAAVYTQTTDVEIEVNGLMTYDRKVMKMPEARLKKIHQKLYNTALVKMK